MGYCVYVIAEEGGECCKVGISGDVDQRRRELQGGNRRTLVVVKTWKMESTRARMVETVALRLLNAEPEARAAELAVGGPFKLLGVRDWQTEWVSVPTDEVVHIVNRIVVEGIAKPPDRRRRTRGNLGRNAYTALPGGWMNLPVFADEPYGRRCAWIWLIENASREEPSLGTLRISYRQMADAWRWDLGKVQRFLTKLKDAGMVTVEAADRNSVITILDFDELAPSDVYVGQPPTDIENLGGAA